MGSPSSDKQLDESKFCIFIPSYNAEKFIEGTVRRIPWNKLSVDLDYAVLFIDNQSIDNTWKIIQKIKNFLLNNNIQSYAILNDINLGYGGSIKKAFDFCEDNNFGLIGILHADGQYAPEELPRLINKLRTHKECALVYGSRLLGQPLIGGMPYYKFAANIVLTWIQNKILQSNYSEFHSGYRFYRMNIIKNIPYKLNSDYFDFDNQIIFQIHHNKYGIYETEIPTFYGDEISYVSPIRTPLAILINILLYIMHKSGLAVIKCYSTDKDTS